MPFNSYEFLFYFAGVFILYWSLSPLGWKWQNVLLVAAGYAYYASWSRGYLEVLVAQTLVHFGAAWVLSRTDRLPARRAALWTALGVSVGALLFFKSLDLLRGPTAWLPGDWQEPARRSLAELALPVGLSFYTFQLMGYTIDVYRKKQEAVRRPADFALFACFFPQVLAGPIERAGRLLPQIQAPRRLTADQFYRGCYLVFWGLVEKLFIADNLGRLAGPVFAGRGGADRDPWMVLVASYAIFYRIFCDFDGYCNIARGLAKMLGFELSVNFRWPHLAASPMEYWRRWHITLTEWLRDYVYTPLLFGGRGPTMAAAYRGMIVVLVLVGLWHGLSWKFLVWGLYQGAVFTCFRLLEPHVSRLCPPGRVAAACFGLAGHVTFVFFGLCIGSVLFWADSFDRALRMSGALLAGWGAAPPQAFFPLLSGVCFYVWVMPAVGWLQKRSNDPEAVLRLPAAARALVYAVWYVLLVVYGVRDAAPYVYFGF